MTEHPSNLTSATTSLSPQQLQQTSRQIDLLRRVAIFQLLSPVSLEDMARVLVPMEVAIGDVVIREGEPGTALYLIETGILVVETGTTEPRTQLARLGPGEFFGEVALITDEPRNATVRAETHTKLWVIHREHFNPLLRNEPVLAQAVREAVARRQTSPAAQDYAIDPANLATLLAEQNQVTIGRNPENDLVLSSPSVSGKHAVIRRAGDAYEVADLGSSSGTFLNGVRVRTATLKDGDQLWIADQRLIFDHRDLRQVTEPPGIRIDAHRLRQEVKGGKNLLQEISLTVLPGEFVAIVGGSGAGKSTLMDALSGVRPATQGQVSYNGSDFYSRRALFRTSLGYVPQDDIIHLDLPVRLTLRYAAKLRLPHDTTPMEREAAIDRALGELGMTPHAGTRVSALSGGQRKRASIGVELLTRPRVFFLDEPTSGLDPATDRQTMILMRELAQSGSTVVLTTHATKNVALCDKIVFLARGGYLAFVGTPARALEYFGVESFDEIYTKLEDEATPEDWATRFRASPDHASVLSGQLLAPPAPDAEQREGASPGAGYRLRSWFRQLRVLSQRNAELYLRNPARIIPLFVQPLGFGVLMILLFRGGLFDLEDPNPTGAFQLLWIFTLTCFLFGLLFSIQEVVKEFPIVRRERMVNLPMFAYLLSKVAFLAPVLVVGVGIMTTMLWATGRLPDAGLDVYLPLFLTLVLAAFNGLAIALFTSAAVKTSQTATDLLAAWIMPQVLFSGAVIPVPTMNTVGEALSHAMTLRWALEAGGQITRLPELFAAAGPPIGDSLLLQYGTSFDQAPGRSWIVLAVIAVIFLGSAWTILRRRTRN